ncbi:hypothetical protein TNCV_4837351 [Trichonephila clavipes]|nr:hypothetical protein TNCV_4837351 [Trichonephila clavipes]
MHNITVQPPRTMVSLNSNPTISMLHAEAGFISNHDVIPFHCPCSLFIVLWGRKRLWFPVKGLGEDVIIQSCHWCQLEFRSKSPVFCRICSGILSGNSNYSDHGFIETESTARLDSEAVVQYLKQPWLYIQRVQDRNFGYYVLPSLSSSANDETSVSIMIKLKIFQTLDVHLQWAPSHVSIGGNEIADRLAKEVGWKELPFCTQSTPRGLLKENTMKAPSHLSLEEIPFPGNCMVKHLKRFVSRKTVTNKGQYQATGEQIQFEVTITTILDEALVITRVQCCSIASEKAHSPRQAGAPLDGKIHSTAVALLVKKPIPHGKLVPPLDGKIHSTAVALLVKKPIPHGKLVPHWMEKFIQQLCSIASEKNPSPTASWWPIGWKNSFNSCSIASEKAHPPRQAGAPLDGKIHSTTVALLVKSPSPTASWCPIGWKNSFNSCSIASEKAHPPRQAGAQLDGKIHSTAVLHCYCSIASEKPIPTASWCPIDGKIHSTAVALLVKSHPPRQAGAPLDGKNSFNSCSIASEKPIPTASCCSIASEKAHPPRQAGAPLDGKIHSTAVALLVKSPSPTASWCPIGWKKSFNSCSIASEKPIPHGKLVPHWMEKFIQQLCSIASEKAYPPRQAGAPLDGKIHSTAVALLVKSLSPTASWCPIGWKNSFNSCSIASEKAHPPRQAGAPLDGKIHSTAVALLVKSPSPKRPQAGAPLDGKKFIQQLITSEKAHPPRQAGTPLDGKIHSTAVALLVKSPSPTASWCPIGWKNSFNSCSIASEKAHPPRQAGAPLDGKIHSTAVALLVKKPTPTSSWCPIGWKNSFNSCSIASEKAHPHGKLVPHWMEKFIQQLCSFSSEKAHPPRQAGAPLDGKIHSTAVALLVKKAHPPRQAGAPLDGKIHSPAVAFLVKKPIPHGKLVPHCGWKNSLNSCSIATLVARFVGVHSPSGL